MPEQTFPALQGDGPVIAAGLTGTMLVEQLPGTLVNSTGRMVVPYDQGQVLRQAAGTLFKQQVAGSAAAGSGAQAAPSSSSASRGDSSSSSATLERGTSSSGRGSAKHTGGAGRRGGSRGRGKAGGRGKGRGGQEAADSAGSALTADRATAVLTGPAGAAGTEAPQLDTSGADSASTGDSPGPPISSRSIPLMFYIHTDYFKGGLGNFLAQEGVVVFGSCTILYVSGRQDRVRVSAGSHAMYQLMVKVGARRNRQYGLLPSSIPDAPNSSLRPVSSRGVRPARGRQYDICCAPSQTHSAAVRAVLQMSGALQAALQVAPCRVQPLIVRDASDPVLGSTQARSGEQ